MRNWIFWILIIGGAALWGYINQAKRDDQGQVVQAGDVSVFELRPGDCVLQADLEGEISQTKVVPCAEEYDYEVFSDFDLDYSEHPGEETIHQVAETGCIESFPGYFGISYEESILHVSWLYPTEESWAQSSDRTVSCLAYIDGQKMIGSIRGQ